MNIPIITLDGPTASGKGTVAKRVAAVLNFHLLDSGALYRLVALESLSRQLDVNHAQAHADLVQALQIEFKNQRVFLFGQDVSEQIRDEAVGNRASAIASFAEVRTALVDLQRSFARLPGLVADGRDMGTVIFPNAGLKIFLTADVQLRAQRRFKQLKEKGFCVTVEALLHDLKARDERDQSRLASPLKPALDAKILDTSNLSIEQAVEQIVFWYRE